jgi:hypothetical protein
MVLDLAASLYGWGANTYGQLALGDTFYHNTPTYQPGTVADTIACGGVTSMHINAQGNLFVCGYNYTGELALGDVLNRASWAYNSDVFAPIGVAGGYLHSLFLTNFGQLYASGYGGFGELGNGSTDYTYVPTYMRGVSDVTGMAGGAYHTLILTFPTLTITSLTVNPATVTGGTSATGTVTLSAVAGPGGQQVRLSSNSNSVGFPANVYIAPNSKTATFPITTSAVGVTTVVTFYGLLRNQVSGTLTVQP